MIDELHSIRARMDYDLTAVMSRLESTQRENASLSYEVRVLEKELEIRNEERDFNRRTADVAHKQYLESVKKIAKLETEAQRLRMLVRKRLPGPASLAKMKNVVEVLGRDPAEVTRRRSNPFPIASNDNTSKQIAFLTEQLCAIEEENRLLKEFLNQKTNEFSKSQTNGPSRNLVTSREFSIATSSDMGSDEKVSMAESWAPSCNTIGASDIGLMDDFVEMEKLALVSVDKPFASSNLVQENHAHWIENILKVVAEHARLMQRNSSEMLEDVKAAMAGKNNDNFSPGKNDKLMGRSDMMRSIQRLIELIEGIRLSDEDDSLSPYKASETPTGFTVHIFQWKTSELRVVLETFLQSCTDLLNGKADVVDFAKELTFALEWTVNHCFSLQDVSSVSDEIKKQFEWDETRSEGEMEGMNVGSLNLLKDQLPGWPMVASWSMRNKNFQLEEVRKLKDDLANLESVNKDLEDRLRLESLKCACLSIQEGTVEGQMEVNVADREDTSMKEQEHKISSNEELDAANPDEHVLPESTTENKTQNCHLDQDEITIQSAQEITTASEKLAECQETIINLGKQSQALASPSPRNSPTSEITVSPLPNKPTTPRISLLDKMTSEDATGAPRSPKTKEVAMASPGLNQVMSPRMFVSVNGVKDQEDEEALVNFLSIVPKKKGGGGGGMLKRLFRRTKKGNSNK